MKKIKNKGEYSFVIILIILGFLNVIGTEVLVLSLLAALVEYAIVLFLLLKGDYKKSFIYFIAFFAITLEKDGFIYGEKLAETTRFTFIVLPVIHSIGFYLLAIIYFYKAYNDVKLHNHKVPNTILMLKKWLLILLVTGSISIAIAMALNDNGIMNWSYYPKEAILEIWGFIIKAAILLAAAYIVTDEKWFKEYERHLTLILVSIAIVGVSTFLLGFHGYYGASEIMLSPLALAYTPLLIVFANKSVDSPHKVFVLISGLLIIAASITLPNFIGSKWYMIILAAIAGWFIISAKIKSVMRIAGVTVTGLFFLTLLSEPLITLISGGNEFVEWKLTQAVKTMNIFGQESAQAWLEDMDDSPLYRFDELHNTFIEYTEKPLYAVFGKGLGGTTRHHTNLLYWESGRGNFSESQIKMGAYYSMHETSAVLFLQHGIAGICFFIIMLGMLAKRLYKTPWAMIGFIWVLFYWAYGVSLLIGGVAMVLALREDETANPKLFCKEI